MRARLPGLLAWTSVGATGLLAVVGVGLALQDGGVRDADHNQTTLPLLLIVLATALVYAAVGALVATRRPRNAVGWCFCVLGLVLAGHFAVKAWADLALAGQPGSWPDPTWAIWAAGLLAPLPLLAPALVLLVFPDGVLLSPRWRPVLFLAVGAAVVGAAALSVRPGELEASDFPGVRNPLGLSGAAGTTAAVLADAATVVLTTALALALVSQAVRYRRSTARGRQQIRWIAFPALLNLFFWTVAEFAPAPIDTVLWLAGFAALAALPVGAAVAILRHRLYDIDLIISRALLYGLLTACVVAGYVVIVGYLSALFQTSGDLVISLVATGVVAVIFAPLRDRLQRAVNRLVFGQRDDPYAVLSGLGRRLETALAPGSALQTVVDTVVQALRLPYAAIRVRPPDGDEQTAAETGTPTGTPLLMPLVHHRERMGTLVVCPRRGQSGFDDSDRSLLDDLVRPASTAVHAVRLSAELQRSRERLVAGREEERRRLRRDLHDGIGPQLAAQNLKIGSARAVHAERPELAAELLAELEDDVGRTLADLRRLVDDLRPPALDELGLDGAIAEAVRRYRAAGVRFAVRVAHLPPLPAAVEVAAYRIATEALTNVVRHARATSCEVCLRLDGALLLEVVDDGTGLPTERRAGVGMTSMRERAAELGGSCEIESMPGAGTRVRARLPVTAEVAHE